MPTEHTSSTTPRDFFLWLGAIAALYTSLTSFLVLLFEYINRAFPDALDAYAPAYTDGINTSMAILIVSVPVTVVLFRIIRSTIAADPTRAELWVRKWALVLTLFIAAAVAIIDLVVIINAFLSGEITSRFILKAAVLLLAAAGVFMHFLADMRGYWAQHPRRATAAGWGFLALAVATIAAGFAFVGSPKEMRAERLDSQRVEHLQTIQYQIVNYWQTRAALPEDLSALQDPLSGFVVPQDPETGAVYEYRVLSPQTFELCATFTTALPEQAQGQGGYQPYTRSGELSPWFAHETGRTCFTREIDPAAYPPFPKSTGAR